MDSLTAFNSKCIKGSLSLDRCTFLVFSPRLSLWGSENHEAFVKHMSYLTEKVLQDNLDSDFVQGVPSELFKYHYRTSVGVDIQFGSFMPRRRKIQDHEKISAFGLSDSDPRYEYFPNEYAFRVEFNPNSCNLSSVLPLLVNFSSSGITPSHVRIARLDIAIDYPVDLDPALCLCDRMRKSFIASGPRGIETVYFGSRSSQYYIRVYNKALELSEKGQSFSGPLWRFELEAKKSFFLSEIPDFSSVLQRFSFYSSGIQSDDWKLRLILAYAKENGLKSALAFLPSATRKRYQKIFDDFDRLQTIETPFESYSRSFNSCFQSLRSMILYSLGYSIFEESFK